MPVNPAKQTKEKIIEEELVRRVRRAGGIAEKVTVLGARGFFDRLVLLPGGRVFFVECKRPRGGVISPHQILRHARYEALGARLYIIRNSEDIDALLSS